MMVMNRVGGGAHPIGEGRGVFRRLQPLHSLHAHLVIFRVDTGQSGPGQSGDHLETLQEIVGVHDGDFRDAVQVELERWIPVPLGQHGDVRDLRGLQDHQVKKDVGEDPALRPLREILDLADV